MPHQPAQADCQTCRHFFVTWRPATPRGCRAFGFQCAGIPSKVVLLESGKPCGLHEPRDANRPSTPRRSRNWA